MTKKLLIFDLDDTLLDTTRLLIPVAKTPRFFELIKQPLPLMEGVRENLEFLKSKYQLVLLTYGNVESQKQKIKSLGIESDFKQFYIADPNLKQTKLQLFHQIKKDFHVQDGEWMSIGNRRSTDIREAKMAGGDTCLFLYGEHQNETVEVPEDVPDFQVDHHFKLIKVCGL